MVKKYTKKAFTLAEIMIVFTVIGILTAVLIPTLFVAAPDQEKLRVKKAYNTLTRSIEALTNSGVYSEISGTLESTSFVKGDTDDDKKARARFFCNQLTEALNVNHSNCQLDKLDAKITKTCTNDFSQDTSGGLGARNSMCLKTTTSGSDTVLDYEKLQGEFDTACESYQDAIGTTKPREYYNFTTSDNILWSVQLTNFAHNETVSIDGITIPVFYNLMCFNVDNAKSATQTYGIGIRKDGKVLVGSKLQEILDEDMKDEE